MRTLPVFYLLVFYIFMQFGWWAFLLVQLNNEVAQLKYEVILLSHEDQAQVQIKQQELDDKLHNRWLMVVGEASVFVMFLTLGIINVRRSLRREEELSQQQKNFLHSITHELKSPIASIKLYLQTIQKRDIEKEKQFKFISHAINDTDRLNQLVENILFAAQLENRNFGFKKEKINITELIEKTLQSVASNIPKNISLSNSIEKGIFLECDSQAIVSLLNNLIENAIKYSDENSTMHVVLKKEEEEVCLTVSDQGPGIPEEEKKNIFQKFYRIGNEETRANKGTGLGLFIANHIAINHNAKISVRDNLPKGSIFEVRFNQ